MAADRFDKEASAWDSNPVTVKSSELAMKALLSHVPALNIASDRKGTALNVLELGCGTGLLSFQIAPYVQQLTAVDTSSGMISALKENLVENAAVTNIKPVCALIEDADDARIQEEGQITRFDLIISHLVLHHIPSLPKIFSTMYSALKQGGSVALTDFENFGPEARRFHPKEKMEGVERHGIHRDEMRDLLSAAGFQEVHVEEAFRLDKPVEGGGQMEFPFLICLAKKI